MQNSSKNLFILFLSFFLVSSKWLVSYYFYYESLDVKIIFDSVTDGKYYYPLIKFLSSFNFNYSFDQELKSLKIIPLPFGGIIWHSIFFYIIGFSSFFVMEIFSLFLFIFIFTSLINFIFRNNLYSILFSLLFFLSPSLIELVGLNSIQPIKIFADNIYNFRVPRPMISNLYFFGFCLIIIKMYKKNFFSYKYLSLLGVILGLSLSSFYYHFFLELLSLLIVLIVKFKSDFFFKIKINYKPIILSIFLFFLTIIPFLMNLLFHETDFTNRQCIFELGIDEKKILLKHLIFKFLSIKFLIFFLFITLLNFVIRKFFSNLKFFFNSFFIIFLSSIFTPIFFVLLSNKSCVFYHFINLIILNSIIYFLFFSLILITKIPLNKNKLFIFTFIILFVFINIFIDFKKQKSSFKNLTVNIERDEFNEITQLIKKDFKINQINLLTFDTNLMIWAILNDIKYMSLINGLFSSKKDFMLEDDLISAFKILNQNKISFFKFIQNNKESWRYMNHNLAKIFFYKYQANSVITFNKSKNFLSEELNTIQNSSPLLHQQSILPLDELERLLQKFDNFNSDLIYPEVIVLDKDDHFLNLKNFNSDKYCNIFDGKKYILFFIKENFKC